MSSATFVSVDQYIAAQPQDVQKALKGVRSAIRKALPNATEVIAYSMPTYKLGNVTVLHFAAWKDHYALYLSTKPIVAEFQRELQGYKVDKGTIRFSSADPVPEKLIERIVRFRASY